MATEETRTDLHFPFPFSGISDALYIPDLEKFRAAVALLSGGCGHAHNYAVQADGQVIYTSAQGINCIVEDSE